MFAVLGRLAAVASLTTEPLRAAVSSCTAWSLSAEVREQKPIYTGLLLAVMSFYDPELCIWLTSGVGRPADRPVESVLTLMAGLP